jgi:hypothetical protein
MSSQCLQKPPLQFLALLLELASPALSWQVVAYLAGGDASGRRLNAWAGFLEADQAIISHHADFSGRA